jgi:hypothetical protein
MLHYRYCNTAATELELKMTFRQPYQDPRSERLLLVVLEDAQYQGSEYRHIRATVIRRAVAHTYASEADALANNVKEWNDEYPSKCQGYRVASYVFPTPSTNVYVDDLELRGQIDVMPRPLCNGRPYGNNIRFKPHQVEANNANAILDFYKKFGKFVDKHSLTRQDDDFYVALNHLAQFLKITRVVFYKSGVRHCGLGDAQCFDETDIAFASVRINEMLAPFLREAA